MISPAVRVSIPKVRKSVAGLFTAASMVIGGVALNRIDVFLVAYKPLYPQKTYFPSVFEIMVTVGLICALVLVYRFVVLNFPVITGHPATEPASKAGQDRLAVSLRKAD